MKTLQISINFLSLTIACYALFVALCAARKADDARVEIAPTGWQCADLVRDQCIQIAMEQFAPAVGASTSECYGNDKTLHGRCMHAGYRNGLDNSKPDPATTLQRHVHQPYRYLEPGCSVVA